MDVEKVIDLIGDEEKAKAFKAKYDLGKQFKADLKKGKIKVDFNGHYGKGIGPVDINTIGDKWAINYYLGNITSASDWVIVFGDDRPFEPSKESPVVFDKFLHESCGECGNRTVFVYDGETVFVARKDDQDITRPCAEAGGIKAYTSTFKVPSGKIVFANDLRSLVPEADKDRYVNHSCEIRQSSWDYAEHGMSYGFTGNSCPSVFRHNDTIVIGNDNESNTMKGKEVGSICTDLWWYSAMDLALFLQLAEKHGWSDDTIEKYMDDFILKVTPGEYEVTHDISLSDYYEEGVPEIFATMRLKE